VTYDEAVSVVELMLAAFPNERAWAVDEIRMYAQGIERVDAAVATKTVVRARDTMTRRPSVADFLALSRSVEAGAAAPTPKPYERPSPRELPFWVKRYFCARYFYARFGKEQDMRVFPEHKDWQPPGEMMPPEEWVAEANALSSADAYRVLGSR